MSRGIPANQTEIHLNAIWKSPLNVTHCNIVRLGGVGLYTRRLLGIMGERERQYEL